MSVTKLFPSGAWEVMDIIKGYLIRRIYYGHSKHGAIAAFRAEVGAA